MPKNEFLISTLSTRAYADTPFYFLSFYPSAPPPSSPLQHAEDAPSGATSPVKPEPPEEPCRGQQTKHETSPQKRSTWWKQSDLARPGPPESPVEAMARRSKMSSLMATGAVWPKDPEQQVLDQEVGAGADIDEALEGH
ncbi:hypothetical protein NL676_031812 [Syzygium grande]|nr:hypothetical protein NL676_031812 [Syzygium grande]